MIGLETRLPVYHRVMFILLSILVLPQLKRIVSWSTILLQPNIVICDINLSLNVIVDMLQFGILIKLIVLYN